MSRARFICAISALFVVLSAVGPRLSAQNPSSAVSRRSWAKPLVQSQQQPQPLSSRASPALRDESRDLAFSRLAQQQPQGPSTRPATPAGLAQDERPDLPLSHLNVGPRDPLYTTYAAPLARSEYFADAAYHLNYYTPELGVTYSSQKSGDFALGWRLGKITAIAAKDFYKAPVIHRSYTDLVELEYWPFTGIQVRETFDVYSSRLALLEVEVSNLTAQPQNVMAYAYYQNPETVSDAALKENQLVTFTHTVDPKTWFESPQPRFDPKFNDVFLLSVPADTWSGHPGEGLIPEMMQRDFLNGMIYGKLRAFALAKRFNIPAGGSQKFRIVRGQAPAREAAERRGAAALDRVQSAAPGRVAGEGAHPTQDEALIEQARKLLNEPLAPIIAASEAQYRNIPRLKLPNLDYELAYWSAFTLVRQQMMPPEGESRFNYYLFSREPTWSWGHEGQVFHESISMLSYVFMDPQSAEDSQRVFIERQRADGYIAYRIGPYVTKTFPLDGEDSSSAPFFNWTNWEIYQVAHDRKFLEEAYASGTRFADFILKHRNKHGDGFLEWGGNAMLECVRDELDAVWTAFGGGDASPKKVKAMDLMAMMVMEMRSLAHMATELGKSAEAQQWNQRADQMANLIRARMWDPQTQFFYNVARDTGTFVSKDGVDVRRKEIIGFLPMWAGFATKNQAEALRRHLLDPAEFWRAFGVPTLAASDPYYDPYITKCCQWNGGVWLLWDYMVFRGLLNYGDRAEAEELVKKNLDAVTFQLRSNHRFWESFSPDFTQLNSPKNYLWDTIIARMLLDLYGPSARQQRD